MRVSLSASALYRRLAEAAMRLSPGSPLRGRIVVRLVQHSYAAANRRDFDLLLMGLDPEIEFRPRGGLIAADVDAVSGGREGYATVWERTLDAFGDLQIEPEECLDLGEKLLITVKFEAHGSGSGVPVSQPQRQAGNRQDRYSPDIVWEVRTDLPDADVYEGHDGVARLRALRRDHG